MKFGENLTGNQIFTWDGYDYACIPGAADNERDIVTWGGTLRIADLILKVRTNVFADGVYPKSQMALTFNNVRYRIALVEQDVLKTMLKLKLVSDTRM